jgi:hypothetical protein
VVIHADDWTIVYVFHHGARAGCRLRDIQHGLKYFGMTCEDTSMDFEGPQGVVIIVLHQKHDISIFEPRVTADTWWGDKTQAIHKPLDGELSDLSGQKWWEIERYVW